MARWASPNAASVMALFAASELAMAMRPKRCAGAQPGALSTGQSLSHATSFGGGVVVEDVAVRPAVDGDRLDVAGRIETTAAEHAPQLIADLAFERLEGRGRSSHIPLFHCSGAGKPRIQTAPGTAEAPSARPACAGSDTLPC